MFSQDCNNWCLGGGGIQPNAITAKRTTLPNSNVMALLDIQKVIVGAAAHKKYSFSMAYVAIL
jgi:hypothetical protein